MASLAQEKPKERQLKLINKLAYGTGDLSGAIFAGLYGFFMLLFLMDDVGLSPARAGAIFAIVQIFDAVTDPLVGSLSDRTRSRWGRKRPWLLFGAVPFGVAFFMHWLVPPLGQDALFFYYLAVGLFLRAAFTAVNVPYAALTPALTNDYDERTQLNTFRFFFSIVGSMTAIILHPNIVALGSDRIVGHAMSGGVWMIVMIVSIWLCFAGTYELSTDEDDSKKKQISSPERLRIVLKNRPYLIVTGLYLLSWLTLQFIQVNLQAYTRYWLDAEDQFTYFVAIIQGTAALFLPIWTIVTTKIGKKKVYYIGASIFCTVLVLIFFLQPGQATLLYVASFFAGMGVSVGYLIPWSMLPDVIEYNELETGERQEGVFYGMFVFLQKLGISVGLFLSGLALEAAGYITPKTINGELEVVIQPDNVLLALRLFVSWIPAIILAISIPLAIFYPITREKYQDIQAQLEVRKAAQ